MTSCDCSCALDGCGPELFEEHIRTAKKEHYCCECGSTIKVGDKYEWVRGLWDGYFDTFKTCLTCVNIRRDFCPGGFMYGDLREMLWDCLGIDYVNGASK